MNYEVKGTPFPVLVLNLAANEVINCQKGGMAWMTPNMQMQTKTGGIGKMFGKMVTGESMFTNKYVATGGAGMISINTNVPGQVIAMQVTPDKPIITQKSAYLASTEGVEMSVHFQKKLGAGFFGGEGFIMQKFSGNGMVFFEIDGSCIEYDLAAGQSLILDTGYLAAMDATCQMTVETVKGVGNVLFGGEGLFNTKVTGPGHIWVQTMPVSAFAGAIAAVLPKSN